MVADRTRENCKSWQTLKFDRRPVVFIKITGTHNTANEVFHCVHFECPAPSEMGENRSQMATATTTAITTTTTTTLQVHLKTICRRVSIIIIIIVILIFFFLQQQQQQHQHQQHVDGDDVVGSSDSKNLTFTKTE